MPSWTQIPEGPSSVFCMLTSSMENGQKCSNCLKDGRLSKKQDATTMFPPLSSNQVLHTDVHVRHLHITNTHTHIPCTFHIRSVAYLFALAVSLHPSFGSFNRPLSAICPWRSGSICSTRISLSTS